MKRIVFCLIAAGCLFVSCGKKASFESPMLESAATSAVYNGLSAKKAVFKDNVVEMDLSEAVYEAEEAASGYEVNRKLIKTGNVTLEAENFNDIDEKISAFVKLYNGYVTDSYVNEMSFGATIKIPEQKFDEAMNSIGTLGKVKYKSENNRDVTDEYYDLESRLESKKILRDKLESYLKKSKDMKELLEVERQLNEVISDLEAMESRMKRLSNQIDYSTIYVNIQLPVGFTDEGFRWPDLGGSFRELGANFVGFLAGFLMFIIYAVIFGVPILAFIALLYWLFFGKIGLLVKLFKKLKK